jgi:hypothetical protein
MGAILAWVGSFLSGPLLAGALKAYQAKLANDNNADQRTADLLARELAVEQREAEVNSQVVIAEQGRWYTALPRPLFAAPFIIYVWKLIVWDKVIMHGATATDPLSPELWQWGGIVLTAYFAGRSLEKAAAVLKRK